MFELLAKATIADWLGAFVLLVVISFLVMI